MTDSAATDTSDKPHASSPNGILEKMLGRLFASLINGPSLNCRPHSSRQRIDLSQLAKLRDQSAEALLMGLLEAKKSSTRARVAIARAGNAEAIARNPEEESARQAYSDQQAVLTKLRLIAEDARTYEHDTGAHVLQIGFPLLSLPPGSVSSMPLTRRMLAPVAFIPVSLAIAGGPMPSISLECRERGADLVVPNVALLAWIEQQTGQGVGDLVEDAEGEKPWKEIAEVVRRVCQLLHIEAPATWSGQDMPADFTLMAAPRGEGDEARVAAIVPSAVLGLFPMNNQGILRDMQALAAGEKISGPIENFIRLGALLEQPAPVLPGAETVEKHTRQFNEERLVVPADPCQARAVRLARSSRGLVIHGPPGTGKSQTIANIIGDHVARGQRVLFVCDKRTALDVVMNRLSGMGMGHLCAIVHDAQRDQRELYKSVREQLDGLADAKTEASAEGSLAKLDKELQAMHSQLTVYHTALMHRADKDSLSFHEHMGRWLAAMDVDTQHIVGAANAVTAEVVEEQAHGLSDLLDRSASSGYAGNPWRSAAGQSLQAFLTSSRESLWGLVQAAARGSITADQAIDPATPPIPAGADMDRVAGSRNSLAADIERVFAAVSPALRAAWASADAAAIASGLRQVNDATPYVREVEKSPLDQGLLASVRDSLPDIVASGEQIAALDAYVESAKKWYGVLALGKKSAAGKALAKFGLQPTAANAARVSAFYSALRTRLVLERMREASPGLAPVAVFDDAAIIATRRELLTLLTFLYDLGRNGELADIIAPVQSALAQPEPPQDLLRGLRATSARVEQIKAMSQLLPVGLFSSNLREETTGHMRTGKPVGPHFESLERTFPSIESVLRVREGLDALPEAIKPATEVLVEQGADGAAGLAVMQKLADTNAITGMLNDNPVLLSCDNQKLQSSFERYQKLDQQRKQLTREVILHRWTSRQKERLCATTNTRLNSLGADIRRRLTSRGERATRLRQVITLGQGIEGGDPLFDLRPVWMASPQTVAQLFARKVLFDVVIFDEASQCRLEEALPVMLRASRVVIAGDPKQLPPTRFFESAIAASEIEEVESDQQLFESQQSEIEDLLTAALNIEIDECHLDVHYRSRNSDLIEFSNQQFYNSRLQAIPAHPHSRPGPAPITLYKINGVYEGRTNRAEADQVCQIVQDLLKRPEVPSIGIACFNITQRDLIIEKLNELAEEDAQFGKLLAAARERRTASAFDGLFVKNLENVQGDERDHIIISTTYGPDPKGRFYRRFGPIGMSGGGRRLNVLVTRARDEIHLVTSIPESVYRHIPPVPEGQAPGGAWLLLAYIQYAEQMRARYAQVNPDPTAGQPIPRVNIKPTKYPSAVAPVLANRLLEQLKIGSDVHWGNDGFCIDLALHHPRVLHHPQHADDVTIGVLCDLNRFEQVADPVEWEIFRTYALQSQGWQLSRVWTPHLFRDARGGITKIDEEARRVAEEQDMPIAEHLIDGEITTPGIEA